MEFIRGPNPKFDKDSSGANNSRGNFENKSQSEISETLMQRYFESPKYLNRNKLREMLLTGTTKNEIDKFMEETGLDEEDFDHMRFEAFAIPVSNYLKCWREGDEQGMKEWIEKYPHILTEETIKEEKRLCLQPDIVRLLFADKIDQARIEVAKYPDVFDEDWVDWMLEQIKKYPYPGA